MTPAFKPLAALALCLAMGSTLAANVKMSLSDKASLQAGLQQHIDRNLVDGAYLRLNPGTGEVTKLHPVTAHPMILRMGSYYVLCSDFRDAKGEAVNVDFYMAPRGKGYVVFHAAAAQRADLEKLMKAGKAEMVD